MLWTVELANPFQFGLEIKAYFLSIHELIGIIIISCFEHLLSIQTISNSRRSTSMIAWRRKTFLKITLLIMMLGTPVNGDQSMKSRWSIWGRECSIINIVLQLRVIVQAIILLLSTIGNTLVIQKIINNLGSSCSRFKLLGIYMMKEINHFRPNILFLNLASADCFATVFTVAGINNCKSFL